MAARTTRYLGILGAFRTRCGKNRYKSERAYHSMLQYIELSHCSNLVVDVAAYPKVHYGLQAVG